MSSEQQQKAQEQPLDGVWYDKYSSLSRIYNYEFVHNSINYGKSWYDYIKDSNSLVKSTLTMGENSAMYVGAPIINTLEKYDNYVKKIDDFGNSGLDMAEKKIQDIKETGDNIIKKFDSSCDAIISTTANYTPNKVNDLALTTSNLIEKLIDSILPPPESEDLSKLTDEDKFELEKRMKFLLKLRKRLNATSITHIPSNSYKTITGAGTKSLHLSIDKLNDIVVKIQNLTVPGELTRAAIDNIYATLDACVAQVVGIAVYLKKIDLSETLISLGELSKTIKESKINILNIEDGNERVNKLKEDISQFLKKAADTLSNLNETGKDKLETLKNKDYVYFNMAVGLLEDTVQSFVNALNSISNKLKTSPTSPNVTNEENQNQNQNQNESESSSSKTTTHKKRGKKHQQNQENEVNPTN
ncbi:hypothetical protein DICPUDRAFT_148489 [Dictyostelium purpureum]|uniref:Uncharacterized protein n=1 Tax=Dictyostelium purpureum TaxID=5786 RepID=F0ZB92_DICPU|nr:uncharacterized protein DICPUDRAFT_148489 [Dictyostelium purpureum]EGC38801.1 hypothetical protein DICPUDRAFT_148489 [Dictyostelium purpureum]|eukprot:XP_003284695.1 hypothetical protein DICPUDRAFT_148489 [Dictyostelium purpureum]